MKKVFIKTWGMPLLLAAFLLYGLISALTGDGAWDILAWVFLSIPVAVIIRYYYF